MIPANDDNIIIHSPDNDGPIGEVFAWLSIDAHGEGVIACELLNGYFSPLVTGKRSIAEGVFRERAAAVAAMTGRRLRLVRFIRAETIEERLP